MAKSTTKNSNQYKGRRITLVFPTQNKSLLTDGIILAQKKGLTFPSYVRLLISIEVEKSKRDALIKSA